MMKLSKNQKGFTAVEGLLIVLILVVIDAVGYMVYHNNHRTNKTNSSTTKVTPSSSSTPHQQSNLKQYTFNGISFSYPSNWTIKPISFPNGDAMSLSSLASFDEGTAETTNDTQHNNNDVLIIQEQNSTTSSYYNASNGPFGSGNYLVSSNMSINGSSNNCLVGYSANGQDGSPSNLSRVDVLTNCDASRDTGNPFLASGSGKYSTLEIQKVNQDDTKSAPISTNSSDYSSILSVIESMKF